MAVAYLYPSADHSQTLPWPLAGPWYTRVDDPFGAYDDDATYNSNPGGAGGTVYEFYMDDASAYPMGAISDVLYTTRQRRELVINPFSRLRIQGSQYWAMNTASVPYVTQTTNSGTNPHTALPWTTVDLDELRFTNTITSAGAGQYARVTALNITVTYTPQAGVYTWLVSSWLPPLIASGLAGANICMRDLKQMCWMLRGKGMKSQPTTFGEYAMLLEGFKHGYQR